MEKRYKPFDLEAAKAGKPVIRRNGTPATFLCVLNRGNDIKGLAFKVDSPQNSEYLVISNIDGRYGLTNSESDIVMFIETREIWKNVYRRKDNTVYLGPDDFLSEKQAKQYICTFGDKYVKSVLCYSEEI